MGGPTLDSVTARAFEIPTDRGESDGTLAWDSTQVVVVEATAGPEVGVGWSYTHAAAAHLVNTMLADVVVDLDDPEPVRAWWAMVDAVRNIGRHGIAAAAVSAVDVALWDLRARRADRCLADELGRLHETVPSYGSGGFCTYGPGEVAEQLGGWVADGMRWVKMKVARHPEQDGPRLAAARDAIGPETGLMVDANGAFTVQQARRWADRYDDFDVIWFEEPVTSDDLAGLRLLRNTVPEGMEVSAGEYAWDPWTVGAMLRAEAVDVAQVDVTRVGGFTGFRAATALCDAHHVDVSTHTAPHLSTHAACAARRARHVEWFHDHVRIERLLFDGAVDAVDGVVRPDDGSPGLGVVLKKADAAAYEVRV